MAYPEQVSITTGEVTKENASVTYSVNAGSLPAEASTTAGVAKVPAGELYPAYGSPESETPTDNFSVTVASVIGSLSGYSVGETITLLSGNESDTPSVFTISSVSESELGLTITNPGLVSLPGMTGDSFSESYPMNDSLVSYEGSGEGGSLEVTFSRIFQ